MPHLNPSAFTGRWWSHAVRTGALVATTLAVALGLASTGGNWPLG